MANYIGPSGWSLEGAALQTQRVHVNSYAAANSTNSNGTLGANLGLQLTLTPKASGSHFLIQCHIGIASTTSGNTWATILSRGGTRIGNGATLNGKYGVWFKGPDRAGNNGADGNHGVGNSGVYLDTLGSVAGSNLTWLVGFSGEGGAVHINHNEQQYSGNSYPVESLCSSSLIITEIAN
jgi:hypothetical protein